MEINRRCDLKAARTPTELREGLATTSPKKKVAQVDVAQWQSALVRREVVGSSPTIGHSPGTGNGNAADEWQVWEQKCAGDASPYGVMLVHTPQGL